MCLQQLLHYKKTFAAKFLFSDWFNQLHCLVVVKVNGQLHNMIINNSTWSILIQWIRDILSGDNLTQYIQQTAYFLFVINLITRTMGFYICGRILNICGTMHLIYMTVQLYSYLLTAPGMKYLSRKYQCLKHMIPSSVYKLSLLFIFKHSSQCVSRATSLTIIILDL